MLIYLNKANSPVVSCCTDINTTRLRLLDVGGPPCTATEQTSVDPQRCRSTRLLSPEMRPRVPALP